MSSVAAWLARLWKWIASAFGFSREEIVVEPPPSGPPAPFEPTIELISLPGHGKSSFIWGLTYALRKFDLLVKGHFCHPLSDEDSALLEQMRAGLEGDLPASNDGLADQELSVELRRAGPFGTRPVRLRDRRDDLWNREVEKEPEPAKAVLEPKPEAATAESGANQKDSEISDPNSESEPESITPAARAVHWGVPVVWLLSLADLDHSKELDLLDLKLDRLLRLRKQASFHSETPLRLILVLTKADRLSALPYDSRQHLKEDPVWRAVAPTVGARESFATPRQWTPEAFRQYCEGVFQQSRRLGGWFREQDFGRSFMARVDEHLVDIRFAAVSATGSDSLALAPKKLGLPWAPHRVLDPLFLAFDFDTPGAWTGLR